MGQAIANVKGDVHAGFGRSSGEAFGIAEQQIGRAYLHEQRWEPGQ